MKNRFLTLLLAVSFSAAGQQKIEWASKVLSYSSQLTPVQYSAEQALGKPNVMPVGGQHPNAWMPKKAKKTEYLKVGFEVPMFIRQIAVAESFNPGALYKIYACDEAENEHLVYTIDNLGGPARGFVRNIFIDKTAYKVAAVKLELAGKYDGDTYAIDAVAIADSPYPIVAGVELPKLLRKEISVEALAPHLNTEYDELNPILSPDGKTLYFSRRNCPENTGGVKDDQDIWFAEIQPDGSWGLAQNLRELNSKGPNYVNAVLPVKGKSVLLMGNVVTKKGKTKGGLSKSTLTGGKWSVPKKLLIENDYNTSEYANYFMSSTGVLFMSCERDETRGGRDIYVSFEKADSTFTKPVNLGNMVNTASDETSPFLASDDKTLFFSSTGFSGFGGYDIFVTRRLDNSWTNWSAPENLGPEINSKSDDVYFTLPKDSQYAYFSRQVQRGNLDMVKAKVPILLPGIKIKGRVLREGNPVATEVIFSRENQPVGKTRSLPSGEYELTLPGGYIYQFYAPDSAWHSSSETVDLSSYTNPDNDQDSLMVKTLLISPRPVIVKGKVTDPAGNPVSAVVSAKNQNGKHQPVLNIEGGYQLSLSPDSVYMIFVNEAGKSDSLSVDFTRLKNDTLRMPDWVATTPVTDIAKAGNKTNPENNLTGNSNPDPDQITTAKNAGSNPVGDGDINEAVITVYFAYNSEQVEAEFNPALDSVTTRLNRSQKLKANVAGYADPIGGESFNMELSRRRADNVAGYLSKKGISRERIHTKAYGESKPVTESESIEGNAENRRVELRIRGGK